MWLSCQQFFHKAVALYLSFLSAPVLRLEQKASAPVVCDQVIPCCIFFFMVDKAAFDLGSRFCHLLTLISPFCFHSLSHHFKSEYWGIWFLSTKLCGVISQKTNFFNIYCSDNLKFLTAIAMIKTSSDVILSCKNSTLCIVCPLPCYLQSNNLYLMRLCL